MSLNVERAILKGRLAELKEKKVQLATAIQAKVRAVKTTLGTAMVSPIVEIDLAGALVHLGEAKRLQDEYREVLAQIAEIERELGD